MQAFKAALGRLWSRLVRAAATVRRRPPRPRKNTECLVLQLPPRPRQSAECLVLQLPVELLLLISEQLPPHGRVLLSQTCLDLQAVLHRHRGAAAHLPYKEHIEYLVGIAYDLPNKWVCEECVTLHDAGQRDTPTRPWRTTCHLGWSWLYRCNNIYGFPRFFLHHHHVQIALKYARMGAGNKGQQELIKRILAPLHTGFTIEKGVPHALRARFSAYPRMVDGRFLLMCVWRYHMDREMVSHDALGDFRMCIHQRWAIDDMKWYNSKHFGPPPGMRLMEARRKALLTQGVAVNGFCCRCATDFSVRVAPEEATVKAWYDLGPEGSCAQPAWRVFISEFCFRDACKVHGRAFGDYGRLPGPPEVTVAHEPGSVRKLYERDMCWRTLGIGGGGCRGDEHVPMTDVGVSAP